MQGYLTSGKTCRATSIILGNIRRLGRGRRGGHVAHLGNSSVAIRNSPYCSRTRRRTSEFHLWQHSVILGSSHRGQHHVVLLTSSYGSWKKHSVGFARYISGGRSENSARSSKVTVLGTREDLQLYVDPTRIAE